VEKSPIKIEPPDLDNYTGSPKKKGRGGITKQLEVIDLTDDY
jgi:hypothetical protein